MNMYIYFILSLTIVIFKHDKTTVCEIPLDICKKKFGMFNSIEKIVNLENQLIINLPLHIDINLVLEDRSIDCMNVSDELLESIKYFECKNIIVEFNFWSVDEDQRSYWGDDIFWEKWRGVKKRIYTILMEEGNFPHPDNCVEYVNDSLSILDILWENN